MTLDVDVVAALSVQHVDALADLLEPDYCLDRQAMLDAVRGGGCFNAVHMATAFKVDVFIQGRSPYDLESARRSRREQLTDLPGATFP